MPSVTMTRCASITPAAADHTTMDGRHRSSQCDVTSAPYVAYTLDTTTIVDVRNVCPMTVKIHAAMPSRFCRGRDGVAWWGCCSSVGRRARRAAGQTPGDPSHLQALVHGDEPEDASAQREAHDDLHGPLHVVLKLDPVSRDPARARELVCQ